MALGSKFTDWLARATTFEMDPEIQRYASRQTALGMTEIRATYQVGRPYQAPRGLSEFGTGLSLRARAARKIKSLRDWVEVDETYR